tara:strand:+ start:1058 stop:1693 length:636 start_codon:yes stop_codon:yes gene_type:complete
MKNLPNNIPIFPLSNFIIFPKTTVPLNIFEPRYLTMINDCLKTNKFIGLIQPRKKNNKEMLDLHNVGCLGKITNFTDTSDGTYLIDVNGVSRFNIIKETKSDKPYRKFDVNFEDFIEDLTPQNETIKFSDLESIFKNFKLLFEKKGYMINWESLEKQNLNETINALAMTSPFSLEEKQILLESKNLQIRKNKIAEILSTYIHDNFENTTIQ